jgi:hypothetical protein
MNRQTLSNLCEQIYRRFPQVAGSQPKVQSRPDGQSLIIFRGTAKTADGRTISQTVRVVATPEGKIVKTTTSK